MVIIIAIIEKYSVNTNQERDVMDDNRKRVAIHLSTIIDDNGQMEYNTMQHVGALHEAGHADILTYGEEVNGEEVRNLVTIQEDKVTIKRSGAVMMHQKFLKEKRTENIFKHPHGSVHMETTTYKLHYDKQEHPISGKVFIAYAVKLNGQEERKHELTLTYKEEEPIE